MKLTRVQRTILLAVGVTGSYRSLSRLANDLDLNYSHAYHMVKMLQTMGLLLVARPSKALVLTIPQNPNQAD